MCWYPLSLGRILPFRKILSFPVAAVVGKIGYIIGTIAGAAVTAVMVNTMKKPISELKEAIQAEKEEEELELELDFD